MNTDPGLLPVVEAALSQGRPPLRSDVPFVVRGAASHWRAVRTWSFERLAATVPDAAVELVEGNREIEPTRFRRSTLREYLASLQRPDASGATPANLKEFDLLRAAPQLRGDLGHRELLPARVLCATRSWIGPACASTGLHRDYLDNLAVQVLGVKRWRFVRAGAVERMGAESRKYDPWAVLADSSVAALAARSSVRGDFFSVDLAPGDVLHVPAGWWHEVTNLTPSLMVGGFYGPAPAVLARVMWVGVRNLRHWIVGGDCTCHATP
jgi:lysine-specific demethylase 8